MAFSALWGEREGTRRASDGEGEVGIVGDWDRRHPPHPDPLPPKGGEGDPGAGALTHAGARFARFRLAVAAGGIGGVANHLVAVAGHTARPSPYRFSGDP